MYVVRDPGEPGPSVTSIGAVSRWVAGYVHETSTAHNGSSMFGGWKRQFLFVRIACGAVVVCDASVQVLTWL